MLSAVCVTLKRQAKFVVDDIQTDDSHEMSRLVFSEKKKKKKKNCHLLQL